MSTEQPETATPGNPEPGWYDYGRSSTLERGALDRSILAIGMVIGWFIIWALAQAWPDTFYCR